jgi:hypothetical protein
MSNTVEVIVRETRLTLTRKRSGKSYSAKANGVDIYLTPRECGFAWWAMVTCEGAFGEAGGASPSLAVSRALAKWTSDARRELHAAAQARRVAMQNLATRRAMASKAEVLFR